MVKASCMDCNCRTVGCHAECEEYTEYKVQYEAYKKRIKNGNLECDLVGYRKDKYDRLNRR